MRYVQSHSFRLLCFLVLFASLASATDNSFATYESSILWGEAMDVSVSGNYTFYVKAYGLEVVDISDPLNRNIVARLLLDRGCNSIGISGTHAYISFREGGFYSVDISDPHLPLIKSTFEAENYSINITVKDDVAFLGRDLFLFDPPQQFRDVALVDISNPASPELISTISTIGRPHSVTLLDNYLFIVEKNYGLQIFDISDQTAPSLVGYFAGDYDGINPNGLNYYGVAIKGEVAYIPWLNTAWPITSGLHVLDIIDPANPELINNYEFHHIDNIALDGDVLYLADNWNLYAIDVSSPIYPPTIDHIETQAWIKTIDLSGQYLATTSVGNVIFDISVPSELEMVSSEPYSARVNEVFVSGDYAYIAHHSSGFTVVDISNPQSPIPLSNRPLNGLTFSIQVIENIAYINAHYALEIYDVSDPSNPAFLGKFSNPELPSNGGDFTIQGEMAYYSIGDKKYILDLSNLNHPTVSGIYTPEYIGDIESGHQIRNVNINGNYAYISYNRPDVVHIVDISDPVSPIVVSSYEISRPYITAFHDNYAFISSQSSVRGTDILDVSDPANPILVGHLDTYFRHEPSFSGDFMFIPNELLGFSIYNIADISDPYFVGQIDTQGRTYSVKPVGDNLFIADRDAFLVMSMNLPTYQSGDANNDGDVNVGDPVYIINTVFKGGPPPQPIEAGDSNCDGDVNIGDVVYLVNHIFKGGDAPCYN
ncbi:MAG: dockerin type I domain-containing protein [candidate division Zixibacteria bacterium]